MNILCIFSLEGQILGVINIPELTRPNCLAFDSADAKQLSRTISAHIYFHALWASTDLAEGNGPH